MKARHGDFGPGARPPAEPLPGCWIGDQYFADDDYVGIELALKLNNQKVDPALAEAARSQREQSRSAACDSMRSLGWNECQRLANNQTFRDARIIAFQESIFWQRLNAEVERVVGAKERAIRERDRTDVDAGRRAVEALKRVHESLDRISEIATNAKSHGFLGLIGGAPNDKLADIVDLAERAAYIARSNLRRR